MGHGPKPENMEDRPLRPQERERYRMISGPMRRSKVFDSDGCPQCGVAKVPGCIEKKYCYGVEPDLRRVLFGFPECPIVGPHLHGECKVCGFVWFERTVSDTTELEGRGALRFDEAIEDGKVVPVEGGMALVTGGTS